MIVADWYLAPSLKVLRSEINARWPNRDRTSDGSIGDTAHQATYSDHNPNERGSVDAIDVDDDGIDPYVVIAAFERHPSAHYWIYQRQIADKDDGWRRRPYDGPSPHTEHVHFSIRQTRTAEQDTRPWGLLEDDMPTADEVANAVWAKQMKDGMDASTHTAADYLRYVEANVKQQLDPVLAKLDDLSAKLDQLAQQDTPPQV